jgi:hypothetical protein
LRAAVGKVNVAAANGSRRAVAGRGHDIQRVIGRGPRERARGKMVSVTDTIFPRGLNKSEPPCWN